jgi:hypothetical protein
VKELIYIIFIQFFNFSASASQCKNIFATNYISYSGRSGSGESFNDLLLNSALSEPSKILTVHFPYPGQMSYTAFFSYKKISQLPKKRRNFFNRIKVLSNPSGQNEREYGAFIVEYADGRSFAIKFTSNHHQQIDPTAWLDALESSGIDEKGGRISKIIHIHTHPGNERVISMAPSGGDLEMYKRLTQFYDNLNKELGFFENLEIEAYILPLCQGCGDLVLFMAREQIELSVLNNY